MEFHVGAISFTGPLDLLLELVKTNKCDIKDIFIRDIIDQYYQLIQTEDVQQSILASDFLLMASTLLQIKSRYLIYLNQERDSSENPVEELFRSLEEYKRFKHLAEKLQILYEQAAVRYTKLPEEVFEETVLSISGKTVEDLAQLFLNIIQSAEAPRPVTISYKKISVQEKIHDIELALRKLSKIYFESIVDSGVRDDVVASFLGILELAKDQRVYLTQQDVFQKIMIEKGQYEG